MKGTLLHSKTRNIQGLKCQDTTKLLFIRYMGSQVSKMAGA